MNIGDKIPDLSLPAATPGSDAGAGDLSLRSFKGRKLVLYFYPKDNTPGCTQEGQDFRDLYQDFRKAGCEIVGVSKDSVRSHQNFAAKFNFPFALLADTDEQVCKAFDVIQEKSMYGKKYLGVERSTFLFDGKGVLRQQWRGVKVKGHAAEVLAAAQAL